MTGTLSLLFARFKTGNQRLLVNSLFLIANTFIGSLFGFAFWFVAARTLTPAEVGVGTAYISAAMFLANLGELGLGTVIIRFSPSLGKQQPRLINTAFFGAAVGTLFFSCIFAVSAPLWSIDLKDLGHSILYTSVFLTTTMAFGQVQLVDKLFVAFEKSYFTFIRALLGNILRLIVIVAVGEFFGALGLLLAVGVSSLITLLISLSLFVPRAVRGYRARLLFDWSLLRDRVPFTLGNHLASLLWNAPNLLYPIISLLLLGKYANAQFYINWMLANLLLIIPNAVSTSTFARASVQGGLSGGLFWRMMQRTLLCLIPLVGVWAVIAPLILPYFGEKYVDNGSGLFLYLVVSVFPYTVNVFFVAKCRMQESVSSVVFHSGLTTLLCFLMSAVFSYSHGLMGVGLGWLVGQTLGGLLAILHIRKQWLRQWGNKVRSQP